MPSSHHLQEGQCPDAHAESEAQEDVLHSFGDAKGLAFSRDGKLLAVGVQDAVHVHEWPSLIHKTSIRYTTPSLFHLNFLPHIAAWPKTSSSADLLIVLMTSICAETLCWTPLNDISL